MDTNRTDAILALRNEIQRLLAAALASDQDLASVILQSQQLQDEEILALADQHNIDTENLAQLSSEVDQLKSALKTRDLIGQAKGVIIATMGCSADEAFALLVTQSQHEQRRVSDIAAEITAKAQRTRD